jgi:hypothetical protein
VLDRDRNTAQNRFTRPGDIRAAIAKATGDASAYKTRTLRE